MLRSVWSVPLADRRAPSPRVITGHAPCRTSVRDRTPVGLPENVAGTQDVEAVGLRALDLLATSQGAGYGNPLAVF